MHAALDDFLTCLRETRYYDAHEVLEVHWFPRRFEDDDEIRLLKGFINASVSFELIKRGRPEPSKRAWNNYLKYRPILDTLQSDMTAAYRKVAKEVEAIRASLI
jgi:hypothetical protein